MRPSLPVKAPRSGVSTAPRRPPCARSPGRGGRTGVGPVLPSNQPVGFELPGGAGDQDFDDRDGRNRKEHPDQSKQDGSSQDPDYHHERVKVHCAPRTMGSYTTFLSSSARATATMTQITKLPLLTL